MQSPVGHILPPREIAMFGVIVPEFLSHVLHDSLLLLAVINPLGNIPVYVSLTQGLNPAERRKVFNLAVASAAGLVMFFAIVGDIALREIFQVTMADFQVAGGILLFIVAARGVLSGQSRYKIKGQDYESLALFPFAFPILVGPGTMAVTILIA
jgi:multiple antibiotic resistance protein